VRTEYTIKDLETFHKVGTKFYEIYQYSKNDKLTDVGEPVISADVVNDNIGNLYHIGFRDDKYCACYHESVYLGGGSGSWAPLEICIEGQNSLLTWLNQGRLVPVEVYKSGNFFDVDFFDNLNESTGYQPKLYLRFEPPIYNDALGIKQLDKILKLVENEYPTVSWWEGQEPSTYNPFIDEDDDGGIPDQVKSITIGYWRENPNRLTYGIWDDNDNDYTNAIDGWLWVEERDVDYDKTSDLFNSLNESTYQPRLNLRFEEGISDADELDKVLRVLEIVYPGLKWMGNDPITSHNVIRDGNEQDFEYDPIFYLTIGYFSHAPNKLTYTNGTDGDIDYADSEQHNYNWVEGWQWVQEHDVDYDATSDIFNQLNESVKKEDGFSLIFEPPIEDPRTMEIVLMKLQTIHPDWTWVNNKRLIDYNPFGREIQYDKYDGVFDNVVGVLTVNHPEWEHTNGLSWSSNDYDEPYIKNMSKYDGWEYIRDLDDTPSTEDIFSQLD
jgi:hypothetical protein